MPYALPPKLARRSRRLGRPFTDSILSAIAISGKSLWMLARAAGVTVSVIYEFVAGRRSMRLDTADRLAVPLGLVVARRGAGPDLGADPASPFSSALLSAVNTCGRAPSDLARISGISQPTVTGLVAGRKSINLDTADRLAVPLGLVVARRGAGPAEPAPPQQPFSSAILSAIDACGVPATMLARAAGICPNSITEFVAGRRSMRLDTADRLAAPLGLVVARRGAGPDLGADPASPFSSALLSAINMCGMNDYELSEEAGVRYNSVSHFRAGRKSINLDTADRLAAPLGLVVARREAIPLPRSEPSPLSGPQPPYQAELAAEILARGLNPYAFAKQSRVSIHTIKRLLSGNHEVKYFIAVKIAEALGLVLDGATPKARPGEGGNLALPDSEPTIARPCPVELRGEGFPIMVYGVEVPRMRGVAFEILQALVRAYEHGGGLRPAELEKLTASQRPLRLFNVALDREGFEPLKRVIPGHRKRRGKILEIVDVYGPSTISVQK